MFRRDHSMLIKQESRTAPWELVQANTGQNTAVKDGTAVEAEHREGKKKNRAEGQFILCVIKETKKRKLCEVQYFQTLYLTGCFSREIDLLCQQTAWAVLLAFHCSALSEGRAHDCNRFTAKVSTQECSKVSAPEHSSVVHSSTLQEKGVGLGSCLQLVRHASAQVSVMCLENCAVSKCPTPLHWSQETSAGSVHYRRRHFMYEHIIKCKSSPSGSIFYSTKETLFLTTHCTFPGALATWVLQRRHIPS